MSRKKPKYAVIDAETDPFKFGRIPAPFAWGFFDGEIYREFWGDDATSELLKFLRYTKETYIIFAHNGGKFDFFFLMDFIDNPLKVINGRIVSAKLFHHTVRDSYAFMPVSLQKLTGGKLTIDYETFELENREANKKEISKYLRVDCEELYKACIKFIDRFGLQLTIGATAYKELRKLHPQKNTSRAFDECYRRFYYGGRCQALRTGKITGEFKVYDVNSMYPAVMRDCIHPAGDEYITLYDCDGELDRFGSLKRFNKKWPYFIKWRGKNKNAVPSRILEGENKGGLTFTCEYGEFFTTSHEIKVALKHRLIEIEDILELHVPIRTGSFKEFVDLFMAEKISCELSGDRVGRELAKLTANSGYGKFAQNPENFADWMICRDSAEIFDARQQGYELHEICGDVSIYRRACGDEDGKVARFNNVAIGASITGASRAVLLDALCNSTMPLYCDTDSIICESLQNVEIDTTKIGAWKFEGDLTEIHIAGKKLYAGYIDGKCIKKASKGAKLSGEQIASIAAGHVEHWASDAPAFQFGKAIAEAKFVSRRLSIKK